MKVHFIIILLIMFFCSNCESGSLLTKRRNKAGNRNDIINGIWSRIGKKSLSPEFEQNNFLHYLDLNQLDDAKSFYDDENYENNLGSFRFPIKNL